ncbi:hypothetical protein [Rubinisphaera italica]|uniref:Uncharacterized protein n=1 Tax=Rubinisphaera italica TaxID=2527969 RepID=A0A5C5XPQ6_9PLAN|nr:hypothetical protein [Rubinisphaera italica]TWT63732.1 hypothetical protein Pan54_44900 [Rubinisphaera italica]
METFVWFTQADRFALAEKFQQLQLQECWKNVEPRLAELNSDSEKDLVKELQEILISFLNTDQAERSLQAFTFQLTRTRWRRIKASIRLGLIEKQKPENPSLPEHLSDEFINTEIEKLAMKISYQAHTNSEQEREEIIRESPGIVYEAYYDFLQTMPFEPFAKKILFNATVDRFREAGKLLSCDPGMFQNRPQPESKISPLELMREALLLLRQRDVYSRLVPRTIDRIDHYCLFTIELRLRWLQKMQDYYEPEELAKQELLSWERYERIRRIHAGWPNAEELWEFLRTHPELDQILNRHASIPEFVAEAYPNACKPHVDWNHHVRKSREIVRNSIGYGNWEQYFANIFRTNPKVQVVSGIE